MMDVRLIYPTMLTFIVALVLSASAAQAQQDMGYLWVTSQPQYALIYLDSNYTNLRTPTSELLSVKPGRHRVELVNQGYKLYQSFVTIEQGRILELNVIFAETDSVAASRLASERYVEVYLTVRSRPPDADVYLDDELIGKTPLMSHAIQPGDPKDRVLKITKPEYKPHMETISWIAIRDRVKISVSVELSPEEKAVSKPPPVESRKSKKFTINNQFIALFAMLVIMIAILAARTVIRLRRRTGDD
jgi:hypothetical protein